MLPARYTRRVELTLKSHLPLDEATLERFLTGAVDGCRGRISVGSPLRDVSVAIDEIGAPEAID